MMKKMILMTLLALTVVSGLVGCRQSANGSDSGAVILKKYPKIKLKEINNGNFESMKGDWTEVAAGKRRYDDSKIHWHTKNLKETMMVESKKIRLSSDNSLVVSRGESKRGEFYKDSRNIIDDMIQLEINEHGTDYHSGDPIVEIYPAGVALAENYGVLPSSIRKDRDKFVLQWGTGSGENEVLVFQVFQR